MRAVIEPSPSLPRLQQLFRTMLLAREVDRVERELVQQGLAFFHVSGAGHEALAILADFLTPDDWLHLHYRDKGLLLARGLPIEEFFRSLLGRADSHSAGRQLSAFYSAPHLHVLSMVCPVGNNALQAVGVAAAVADASRVRTNHIDARRVGHDRPIVVCSVGDGTTQEGEFYEAIAEAARSWLPVLFLIEDNRYSISTCTTGRRFFDVPPVVNPTTQTPASRVCVVGGRAASEPTPTEDENLPATRARQLGATAHEVFGIPIEHVDGTDFVAVDSMFARVIAEMRQHGSPAIFVLHVERLSDHTSADDESSYRDLYDIATGRATADPIRLLEDRLLRDGVSTETLRTIREQVIADVRDAALTVSASELTPPRSPSDVKAPLSAAMTARTEYAGDASLPRLTMREALNATLRLRLRTDARVILVGEDIEDPKGDVFGVTRGLSTEFPGRVLNSALSESTIVGTSIGRALAGQRPVAFIQFADFLPLAFNPRQVPHTAHIRRHRQEDRHRGAAVGRSH